MINVKYEFHVSEKRKIRKMILSFSKKEFFHLAGLQYLKDIALPKNRNTTVQDVLDKKITDELLEKSKYYVNSLKEEKNIRDRICELQYLEQYLDTNNIIKIFSVKDTPYLHSDINADCVIESSLTQRSKTVYIFLKERKEQQGVYCLVSFFVKKNLTYGGSKLYWMLKRKFKLKQSITLYQHDNYKEISTEQNGEGVWKREKR